MMNSITIENSTSCGANCIMCVRDKLAFDISQMSMNTFVKAIHEVNDFYCKFSGEDINSLEWGGDG